MKVLFFHLMPYADLDLNYDAKYDSAWVTFPNSYFDPQKGAGLYNRYLDELEYAEQLDFDGISVNEHHQNAYGLMPAPAVTAAALARRTSKVTIAILGNALPLRENPLTIAEEHAMIDVISGGRLVSGFVRGIGAEYHSFGVNPTQSLARFHEAHDLIVQAWTKPGPFPFHGKYYNYDYVNIWPRPLQNPHPPIWIPSQGSQETIDWASHPDRKYTYLQTFSAIEQVTKHLNMYREKAAEYGYQAADSQLGWAVPVFVAETDQKAVELAKPHIEAFRNKFLRMRREMLFPPGYLSAQSMKRVLQAKGQESERHTCESLMSTGMFICGSPATVRRQLLEYWQRMRFGALLPMLQFGTLPHDLTIGSMTLFGREVLPELKSETERLSDAARVAQTA